MALDSYMYGNPERVLERRQEEEARRHRACGQCVHKQVLELDGKTLYACSKGREYGTQKCKLFRIFTTKIFKGMP